MCVTLATSVLSSVERNVSKLSTAEPAPARGSEKASVEGARSAGGRGDRAHLAADLAPRRRRGRAARASRRPCATCESSSASVREAARPRASCRPRTRARARRPSRSSRTSSTSLETDPTERAAARIEGMARGEECWSCRRHRRRRTRRRSRSRRSSARRRPAGGLRCGETGSLSMPTSGYCLGGRRPKGGASAARCRPAARCSRSCSRTMRPTRRETPGSSCRAADQAE